ncbi:hypothetical protein MPUCK001_30230 [Citrobacter koseri]|nr:hypothetical protein MPUCK001_30230 [Citrobacter koseri]
MLLLTINLSSSNFPSVYSLEKFGAKTTFNEIRKKLITKPIRKQTEIRATSSLEI